MQAETEVKNKIILYGIFLLMAGYVHSQNACRLRIAGKILSISDSLPIKNAEIFIEAGHLKTTTNPSGHFELKNLCPGFIELELDADSFSHQHFLQKLYTDTFIILYLEPAGKTISGVQILRHNSGPNQIKPQDNSIRESGKNLAEQLEILPGVNSLRSGNNVAKPMVQGLSGMLVPIMVNGIKQNGQQWGADHGPESNATAFDVIELIYGARALKYCADAAGGLIELRNEKNPHPGETDIASGAGYQSNGHQINFFSKYLFKPATKPCLYFANMAVRKAGNYSVPGYILPNTGLSEIMFTAGLTKQKSQRHTYIDGAFYYQEAGIYSGSHIGSVQDLLNRIQSSEPVSGKFSYQIGAPRQTVLHAQLRYKFDNKKYYFTTAMQRDDRKEFDFHRSSAVLFPQLNIGLSSATYQGGKIFQPNKKIQYDAGFQGTYYANRYGGYYFIPDFTAFNNGGYLIGKFNHKNTIQTFALRNELFASRARAKSGIVHINDTKTQAATALAWTLVLNKRNAQWQYDLARLIRFPWFNELYSYGVHHGAAAFEKGNANLKKEITYKAAISWNYRHAKNAFYTMVYGNYFQNFINLSPDSVPMLTVRGAFPAYTYRQFTAIYSGIDFQWIAHILPWIEIKTIQSFLYAQNLDNHTYPAYIPPSRSQIIGTIQHKKMELNIHYQYISKQRFYTAKTDYLPPPPAYQLLGVNMIIKGLFKKQNYQFIIGGDNILNTRYRNYLDRFRYFTDMPGRNIYMRLVWNFHHHNEHNLKQ